MLVYLFPKLKKYSIFNFISNFFRSYYYLGLIAILTLLSGLLGLELLTYAIVMAFCLISLFLADDGSAMIAPFFFMYLSFSRKNNDIVHGGIDNSLFGDPSFVKTFTILMIILGSSLLIRLIFSLIIKKGYKRPKLLFGLIALGIAYMLGGLFSDYYNHKTVLFGLYQIISILVPYILIYFTVDKTKLKKDYIPVALLILGFITIGYVIQMYYIAGFDFENLTTIRGTLYTGWGWYNNVGLQLVFAMSGALYFVLKYKKNGPIFIFLSTIFYIFVGLTQSRGCIVGGGFVYLLSVILSITNVKKKYRMINGLSWSLIVALIGLFYIIFKREFMIIFDDIISSLFKDNIQDISSGRISIWKDGLNQFKSNPIFGIGFLDSTAPTFSFLPARYHDTVVQLLASTGLVGLLAYIYHRYETIRLLWNKNPLAISLLVLLVGLEISSIFDCHFFNIGPTIQYGVLFALFELNDNNLYLKVKKE